jgi:hypothetical protein
VRGFDFWVMCAGEVRFFGELPIAAIAFTSLII